MSGQPKGAPLGSGRLRRLGTVLAASAVAGAVVALPGTAQAAAPLVAQGASAGDWTSAGANAYNTHSSATETTISPANVSTLEPKWTVTTGGDVSATPTVVGGYVYAPDWGGNLFKVQASSGRVVWKHRMSEYTGIPGDVSRNSPAFWKDILVTGNGAIFAQNAANKGAYLAGIDATTGTSLWRTQIDDNPAAIVTGSPVVVDGVAYVGVSSKSEIQSTEPTFRGSVVALNAQTGKLLWKSYTVPQGYTGGAVWGSNPAVDEQRGLVYVGTGNNYSVPDGVCQAPEDTGCEAADSDNHQDAVVAFDARTGDIRWATPTLSSDTWTHGEPFGPDLDFGAAPNLFTTVVNGQSTDLLGIGQKSGLYWALDRDTGKVQWTNKVGPGGEGGGIVWGTAYDGKRIYAAVSNADRVPTTITSATGETSVTDGGIWAAVDPATGKTLWQAAVPDKAFAHAFVSAANGVVYSGTLQGFGNNMYALDGTTGRVLWSHASGGAVVGGPAIVDGTVYWGSGYPTSVYGLPPGDNNKLYALAPPTTATGSTTVYVSLNGKSGASDTSCATAAYTSVRAAVRAVAEGGDVVVCGGTFKENVTIDKPLTLEGRSDAILDASGHTHGVVVSAADVTVSGLTVRGALGEGILVDSVERATISGNIVTGNDSAADGSAFYAQCTTAGAEPGDCGGGIHLLGSLHATVQGNTVQNNAAGIVVSDETGPSAHNVISGNELLDNARSNGITLAGRNASAAPGGTPAPGSGGVFDNALQSNIVSNNGLTTPGGGIAVVSAVTGGAVLESNVISGNGQAGVVVKAGATGQDLDDNTIHGNQISTNNVKGDTAVPADLGTTGVVVRATGALTVTVSRNTIASNHFGVWTAGPVTAQGASDNTFTGVDIPVSAH
ncbi:PQQ-binding-like beta-propeller repeat protein [Streptomyces sp. NPDC093516]|uniref:outer membrane protein assembly factor BamB family protein n=1 Tax=Streptomyces sp. NPDC093516 TaxID=3155304 RepID=UPI00343B270C